MIARTLATAAAALAAAVVFACSGGGGTAASAGPVTSVPESRELAQLSPSEQKTFCDDISRFFRDRFAPEVTKGWGCALGASITGAFAAAARQDPRAACQKAYDECVARPADADAGAVAAVGEVQDCDVSGCAGVTVGDYSACLRETADTFASFTFSCDRVGADAGATRPDVTLGPACERVTKACAERDSVTR